jgi:ATP-dependent Zn protease
MNNQNISSSETPVCNSLKPLALAAAGRTGADIERVIREARQKARRQNRQMTYDDIMAALTAGQSSMGPELLWRIAVHESGHALVTILFGIADIQTVSVGNGQGGFVDSLTKTGMVENEDWLQKLIACLLAGRAAETLIFGDTSIGSGGTSASDLARATKLATDAEASLGLVWFGLVWDNTIPCFIGLSMTVHLFYPWTNSLHQMCIKGLFKLY